MTVTVEARQLEEQTLTLQQLKAQLPIRYTNYLANNILYCQCSELQIKRLSLENLD
jgi:hypothetical protein